MIWTAAFPGGDVGTLIIEAALLAPVLALGLLLFGRPSAGLTDTPSLEAANDGRLANEVGTNARPPSPFKHRAPIWRRPTYVDRIRLTHRWLRCH